MNRIVAEPELVQCFPPEENAPRVTALNRTLAELLGQAPVDEESARKAAMDLAAEQLNAIGPEEYETERLRRVFSKLGPQNELDADLLSTSVRQISVQKRKAIVQLKNGQIIKGVI